MQEQEINQAIDEKQQQSQEPKLSAFTKERVEAAKMYIENKYAKLKQGEAERKDNWAKLDEKMQELHLDENQRDLIKTEIRAQEAEQLRKKRQKMTSADFLPIAIIGRGAFGEVRVCKYHKTKEIVAIKKMKKNDMVYKNQISHVKNEKGFLSSVENEWIVGLYYSFQDERYLYLVMEFVPGGDLMTLLMKKDILPEEEAKFYIAETILAVAFVHEMQFIHRDLKPDNILIDKQGHIKLSDFGLCKLTDIKPKINFGKKDQTTIAEPGPNDVLTNLHSINKKNFKNRDRKLAFSTVGTPDYIAPEVFGQKGYTETVDWWSVGVILYEMLVGYPPFFSEDPSVTCQKILHWRKTLKVPPEANLSLSAIDLIKRLVTDPSERLGINGVAEIKAHPFFSGIDWKNIRNKPAPFIPSVKGESDVQNFDIYEEEEPWIIEEPNLKKNKKAKRDVNFIGFTFKREQDQERDLLVQAIENLEEKKYIFDQIHNGKEQTIFQNQQKEQKNKTQQQQQQNQQSQNNNNNQQQQYQQNQKSQQNTQQNQQINNSSKVVQPSPNKINFNKDERFANQAKNALLQPQQQNLQNSSTRFNNQQFNKLSQQSYQQAIQSIKKDNTFNQYNQYSQQQQNNQYSNQQYNSQNSQNQSNNYYQQLQQQYNQGQYNSKLNQSKQQNNNNNNNQHQQFQQQIKKQQQQNQQQQQYPNQSQKYQQQGQQQYSLKSNNQNLLMKNNNNNNNNDNNNNQQQQTLKQNNLYNTGNIMNNNKQNNNQQQSQQQQQQQQYYENQQQNYLRDNFMKQQNSNQQQQQQQQLQKQQVQNSNLKSNNGTINANSYKNLKNGFNQY